MILPHKLGRYQAKEFVPLLMLLAIIRGLPAFQKSCPVNPGNPSTIEDFKAGDASREPYQRATDLVAALQLSRGDWVADVGAGAGYYSMRLSEVVGPEEKYLPRTLPTRPCGGSMQE
jgi:predicted methyltransferase